LSSSRNTRIRIPRAVAPTWWIAALWLVAAEFAQVTLMHYAVVRNIEPSLVFVTVVWYALRVSSVQAAAYGLAAGLLEDILATGTGAAFALSTTIGALVAQRISRGFFADSLPLVLTITVVATLVRQLMFWVIWGMEGYPPGLATMHFHEAIGNCVANALLMLVVTLVARRFDSRYA
jgi:rod shape-determining protein MreD